MATGNWPEGAEKTVKPGGGERPYFRAAARPYWVARRGDPGEKARVPTLPPVVYEDESLIAFDKPSGLLIAPDRWDKTRVNLMDLVHEKMGHGVANVHRIDADTSGLVLCAKTKPALDFLSGQFQSKTVKKTYEAITVGLPAADEYTVDLVLKEDEAKKGRMCVVKKHGKASVTLIVARSAGGGSVEEGIIHAIHVQAELCVVGTGVMNADGCATAMRATVYGVQLKIRLCQMQVLHALAARGCIIVFDNRTFDRLAVLGFVFDGP